eukprot:TRINITY_DN4082_c0_g1_i1.p1 TRINITY_DN4082_c0_g1~~TRINITY_DN4082_c0_g1_i1.p1  ORF type:complete len:400 (-),score=106.83 TRINITY_DN4082_c0_g1_i1:72-1271(-)
MTEYVIQNASHKTYLCGDPNTTVNQKTKIGAWERWHVIKEGNHYLIKSAHGTYLKNEPNGQVSLSQNHQEWEQWHIQKGHNGYYSVKSHHGKYLRGHDKGGAIDSSDNYGLWEEWVIAKIPPLNKWMEYIDDKESVSHLSIPGTHDSASYGIKNIISKLVSETQKLNIEESLNNGVRFLDIRVRLIDNYLVCHHGITYLNKNLDDVLNMISNFLKNNPKECVLMRIKKEHHDEKSNMTFEGSFKVHYVEKRPGLFFQEERVPTLGEVRGKIIVISDHHPFIPGLNFADCRIEDKWEVKELEHKCHGINNHINERVSNCLGHVYSICFFSGYYSKECLNPTKILNPKRFAEDMNPWAFSHVPIPKIKTFGLGILVYDFVNEEMTQRTIVSNPRFYLHIQL